MTASADVMNAASEAAKHLSKLPGFSVSRVEPPTHHVGAVLTDSVLQAGLNYRWVVLPRVERVKRLFPEAGVVSAFRLVLDRVGPNEVLEWSHPEKPRRLRSLTDLLGEEGVETTSDILAWIETEEGRNRLLAVRGIGPKTVDYLGILVGGERVAVDRHLIRFLETIGIAFEGYQLTRKVVVEASRLLNVRPQDLDHAIWNYMSKVDRSGRVADCQDGPLSTSQGLGPWPAR